MKNIELNKINYINLILIYCQKKLKNRRGNNKADDEKWQQLVAKLPWGHNLLLIEKIKDKDIRKIYAENTIKNRWSRNVLSIQIETEFHKRIGNSNNNFNAMLPPQIAIS